MANGNDFDEPSKEQWGSRIGVILAVAGSAVGLGNFLRFPGQAAQNGGGAFMLPYFISLLVLGIPLCWAEWTMGRYGGTRGFNSAPGIYASIWRNRFAKYFGAIALLLPLVIYMYYVLIEAWCLSYALQYLSGDLVTGTGGTVDTLVETARTEAARAGTEISDGEAKSAAFGNFFGQFVGIGKDGAALSGANAKWLVVLLGVFAFNFVLIYRGVAKGIETFCRVAMPAMVVLALIVLVRVLTLPANDGRGVADGLNFMWNPNVSALTNPKTWLAASGQIFFSLSVGFGIIINYASYLSRRDDVVLSGLTSSSMNEFFEVCLGGLITLPVAFIFLGATAGEQGTFGLGFVALPNVFDAMPGGRIFGFLWFFMLFIAAVTSSVSMLQPVIAFLEEGFGLKRHASAAVLGLIAALGCMFTLYFSKGLTALDTLDFWVGTFLIFVLAMFQAILYGWVLGIERGEKEAHEGAHLRIPRFVQVMLKYVVPVYLIAIFVAFCFTNLPSTTTPSFELPAAVAESLDGTDDDLNKVTAALATGGVELTEATVEPWGEKWRVFDKEGMPTHVVERASRTRALNVVPTSRASWTANVDAHLAIAELEAGVIGPAIGRVLQTEGVNLPEDVTLARHESQWTISSSGENGEPLVTLNTVEDERFDVTLVSAYAVGYAEGISRKPVALYSICFIFVLIAFLLLLIHIAGRRWEKEGRFDRLDELDRQLEAEDPS